MSKSPMNQYRQTQVTTASKEQVLLMLYEAAIKHVKKAAECTEKKDLAAKGIAIGKAHDIINELSSSLDHNVGGDISKNLEGLYLFMTRELIDGNIHNDTSKFNNVRKLLETLYEGWKGAVAQVQAERGKK